jgi:hypothetical protein
MKLTSKIKGKCVLNVLTKITMLKINNTIIFVNDVETQDEKNHSEAAKPRISTIQKTKLDTR